MIDGSSVYRVPDRSSCCLELRGTVQIYDELLPADACSVCTKDNSRIEVDYIPVYPKELGIKAKVVD